MNIWRMSRWETRKVEMDNVGEKKKEKEKIKKKKGVLIIWDRTVDVRKSDISLLLDGFEWQWNRPLQDCPGEELMEVDEAGKAAGLRCCTE